MKRATIWGGAMVLWASVSGCGTALFHEEVAPVSNSKRVANVWAGDEDFAHPRICLEYSTAMGEQTKTKVDISAAFGRGKSGSLSYQSATQLARIYNVSDIMQFGHAALYRLCEAWANGALTDAEYNERLGRVLDTMQDLLLVQAFGTEFLNSQAIASARAKYIDLQMRYEEFLHDQGRVKEINKSAKPSDDEQKELKRLNDKLAKSPADLSDQVQQARAEYEKLLRGMPATMTATAATPAPMPMATPPKPE